MSDSELIRSVEMAERIKLVFEIGATILYCVTNGLWFPQKRFRLRFLKLGISPVFGCLFRRATAVVNDTSCYGSAMQAYLRQHTIRYEKLFNVRAQKPT